VVHLWAEDGTLLATASQSAAQVREWRADDPARGDPPAGVIDQPREASP
jgi:hypothetical protein